MSAPACIDDFVAAVDREFEDASVASVSDADLARLVGAAVRLYAARMERTERRVPFVNLTGLTTSAVLTAACEMIREVDVNMFDVAMWFSHANRQ